MVAESGMLDICSFTGLGIIDWVYLVGLIGLGLWVFGSSLPGSFCWVGILLVSFFFCWVEGFLLSGAAESGLMD